MSGGDELGTDDPGTFDVLDAALLTVASVLAGFAFSGLVLFLSIGRDKVTAGHTVAACLLVAAFLALVYSAIALTSSTYFRRHPDFWVALGGLFLLREAVYVLLAGLVLLCASVCLMAFLWSPWVGWTGAILAAPLLPRIVNLYRATVRKLEHD